jgi:ATP-dependent helicase HrpB
MLLSERGLGGPDADLSHRLERLRAERDKRASDARRLAASWARQAETARPIREIAPLSDGALVALAFPDRIAKTRGRGDFTMANGRAASLPPEHALARENFLAIAEIAGRAAQARILAACALTLEEVERLAADRVETRDETLFDPVSAGLRRRRFRRLGAIRLAEQNLSVEPTLENAQIFARGIAALGPERLPWTKAQEQLRDRVSFLRRAEGDEWPDLSDAALAQTAEDWLAPFIIGRASLAAIAPDDLDAALASLLPYELSRRLDAEAPAFFETPAGSRIALDYAAPNGPMLSARVQEFYGLSKHPTLARGRAAVTLELLSPAHRPIQTTRDLPGFWAGSWSEVKKEMKGRYPRHLWPDDPASAAPTTRARPRG